MSTIIDSYDRSMVNNIRQFIKSVCETMDDKIIKIVDGDDDSFLNLNLVGNELNLDPVEVFELIYRIESKYKINIGNVSGIYTVGDLFNEIKLLVNTTMAS